VASPSRWPPTSGSRRPPRRSTRRSSASVCPAATSGWAGCCRSWSARAAHTNCCWRVGWGRPDRPAQPHRPRRRGAGRGAGHGGRDHGKQPDGRLDDQGGGRSQLEVGSSLQAGSTWRAGLRSWPRLPKTTTSRSPPSSKSGLRTTPTS